MDIKRVKEFLEVYTGGNTYTDTWTQSAWLDFAKDFSNQETKQLKEQNQSCAEFLKRMLSISELWTYHSEVKLEHENEAKALESMKNEAEQLLKDLEPTKESK